MAITDSLILVLMITLIGILLPVFRTFVKRKKSSAKDITYYIIHALLFYPIPGMLLGSRQMIAIGNQSADDMINQFESGLSSQIIAINYGILLYLIALNFWLLVKRGNIFNRHLVLRDKWFYLIIILNIGLLNLSINLSGLMYLFLFIIFLLFGKFENSHIKKIINIILLLYFYASFALILLKPEATIFHDGAWAGIFTNPNGIVIVSNFTLILILLAPYFNLQRTKWQYFNIAFLFSMVLMSGSRNALLTFLAIIALYLISIYKLRLIKALAIFLAIPVLYYALVSLKNIDLASLTSSRILIWEYAFDELSKNFPFGLGADFFSLENRMKNFPSHLFFATSSYSSFIDYMVFYGVFGVFLISAFMFSLFKKTKKIHPLFIMFFLLFFIPNLFESFFRPPSLSINNAIFLLALFVINSSRDYFFFNQSSLIEESSFSDKKNLS